MIAMKKILALSFSSALLTLFGCATPTPPPIAPLAVIPARKIEMQKITLGNVQMVLKKGASGDEVIQALSSPNIVTSNKEGGETWVYDKIITEIESAAEGNKVGSKVVTVSSTRTMIVVIKFDQDRKVDTVQYRQTSY